MVTAEIAWEGTTPNLAKHARHTTARAETAAQTGAMASAPGIMGRVLRRSIATKQTAIRAWRQQATACATKRLVNATDLFISKRDHTIDSILV